MTDIRRKSGEDKAKCAADILVQASRQASHSAGTRCFLQAASGNGAKGGIVADLKAILKLFWSCRCNDVLLQIEPITFVKSPLPFPTIRSAINERLNERMNHLIQICTFCLYCTVQSRERDAGEAQYGNASLRTNQSAVGGGFAYFLRPRCSQKSAPPLFFSIDIAFRRNVTRSPSSLCRN